MRFMMMVYNSENDWRSMSEEEQALEYQKYMDFHNEIMRRGILQIAERVENISATKVMRVRGGKPLVTDGPYAETKEQMGGIYIFDVKDLDEALKIAAMIPGATRGAIEVRPIFEDPSMDENA